MPLYTWLCSRGHSSDALGSRGDSSRPCPQCGSRAQRGAVYAPSIARREPFYNGKDFVEASAEMEDRISRQEEANGVEIARPDFLKEAMHQASLAKRSGYESSVDLPKVSR